MNRRQRKPNQAVSSANVSKPKEELKSAPESQQFLQDFFRIFGKGIYLLSILSLLYLLYYIFTVFRGPTNSSKVILEKSSAKIPAEPSETKIPQSPPKYEDYVALAEKKGWKIKDPIEKLEDTIRNYPKIFDHLTEPTPSSNLTRRHEAFEKQIQHLIALSEQEIDFLLRVIEYSPHRRCDLTSALFATIDMMNQMSYRLMKFRLQLSEGDVLMTKALVDQHARQVTHFPLRELLTLTLTKKLRHVILDVNRVHPITQMTALTKAVQFRLYAVFGALLQLGGFQHYAEALDVAISNGDDLAVALLIKLADGSSPSSSVINYVSNKRLIELVSRAKALRYDHIAERLLQVLVTQPMTQLLQRETSEVEMQTLLTWTRDFQSRHEQKEMTIDLFNQYLTSPLTLSSSWSPPTASTRLLSSTSEEEEQEQLRKDRRGDDVIPLQGGAVEEEEDLCDVDRMSLENFSYHSFHSNYVRANRPVLITLPPTSALKEVLSEEALLKALDDVDVIVGKIPYSKLFGQSEKTMTLKEFFFYLRQQSRQLQRLVGPEARSLNVTAFYQLHCQDDVTRCIPDYLFANELQEVAKKMRSRLISALTSFAVGRSNSDICNLWNLLIASVVMRSEDIDQLHLFQQCEVAGEAEAGDDVSSEGGRDLSAFRQHFLSSLPHIGNLQLFVGPALSGAPFHSHGPAINVIARGRKLWHLLPPGRDLYTMIHPVKWMATDVWNEEVLNPYFNVSFPPPPRQGVRWAGRRTLCRLYQEENEILYVPRHWSHQVLNVEETAGFAIEIDNYIY